jgi:uncharacterized membrane protein
MVREDSTTTIWARIHARQALVFGLIGSLLLLVVLALPLLAVVAFSSISSFATIVVYCIGLIIDALVAIGLLIVGARCASRAARGELFSIPLITPIVDRWFRLDGS